MDAGDTHHLSSLLLARTQFHLDSLETHKLIYCYEKSAAKVRGEREGEKNSFTLNVHSETRISLSVIAIVLMPCFLLVLSLYLHSYASADISQRTPALLSVCVSLYIPLIRAALRQASKGERDAQEKG